LHLVHSRAERRQKMMSPTDDVFPLFPRPPARPAPSPPVLPKRQRPTVVRGSSAAGEGAEGGGSGRRCRGGGAGAATASSLLGPRLASAPQPAGPPRGGGGRRAWASRVQIDRRHRWPLLPSPVRPLPPWPAGPPRGRPRPSSLSLPCGGLELGGGGPRPAADGRSSPGPAGLYAFEERGDAMPCSLPPILEDEPRWHSSEREVKNDFASHC